VFVVQCQISGCFYAPRGSVTERQTELPCHWQLYCLYCLSFIVHICFLCLLLPLFSANKDFYSGVQWRALKLQSVESNRRESSSVVPDGSLGRGRGSAYRSWPTGGTANGIPRNCTTSVTFWRLVPLLVDSVDTRRPRISPTDVRTTTMSSNDSV